MRGFTIRAESTHLCDLCSHGTVARNKDGRIIVSQCHEAGANLLIREEVKACTSYRFAWSTEWEFKDQAFILERNKKGEIMGFRPPKADGEK